MSEMESVVGDDKTLAGGIETSKENNYPKHFVDKILGEKKKTVAENEELKKKLAEIESEKLQAQGKDKELAEKYKKDLQTTEQKLKSATLQYAQTIMFSAIKAEAVKQGCVDAEALIKLADLSSLDVDTETFTVSPEGLTTMISQMAAEKAYLFKNKVAGVKDAVPGSAVDKPMKMDAKNLSKMKASDLQKVLAMKLGQK